MVNTQSTFHTWSTDGQHGQQTVNTAPEDFPVDELGLSPLMIAKEWNCPILM
jgi:hypothetical protein